MASPDGWQDGDTVMELGQDCGPIATAKLAATWEAFSSSTLQAADEVAPGTFEVVKDDPRCELIMRAEKAYPYMPIHFHPLALRRL